MKLTCPGKIANKIYKIPPKMLAWKMFTAINKLIIMWLDITLYFTRYHLGSTFQMEWPTQLKAWWLFPNVECSKISYGDVLTSVRGELKVEMLYLKVSFTFRANSSSVLWAPQIPLNASHNWKIRKKKKCPCVIFSKVRIDNDWNPDWRLNCWSQRCSKQLYPDEREELTS